MNFTEIRLVKQTKPYEFIATFSRNDHHEVIGQGKDVEQLIKAAENYERGYILALGSIDGKEKP